MAQLRPCKWLNVVGAQNCEERGRQRQALRHAGCKPGEFRLHLMCSNTGRFVFRCSQCEVDGVMPEVSGHAAAVVVTQVTGMRIVATEV